MPDTPALTAAAPSPMTTMAPHLEALREELGLSVPDLADRIGRDRTHVWRVLNGQAPATPDLVSRCLIGMADVIASRRASV